MVLRQTSLQTTKLRLRDRFTRPYSKKALLKAAEDLLQKERKYLCNPRYVEALQSQANIKRSFRSKLASWTFAFETEFNVERETLLLAMNLIDRFLSKKVLSKQYLQLLAITAVFISSKVLERKPLKIRDLAYLAEGMYTMEEILRFERVLLVTLNFRVHSVTSLQVFNIFLELIFSLYPTPAVNKAEIERLGNDLLNTTYFSYSFIEFSPSQLVVAVIMIMGNMIKPWEVMAKSLLGLLKIEHDTESFAGLKDDILAIYNYNYSNKENLYPAS